MKKNLFINRQLDNLLSVPSSLDNKRTVFTWPDDGHFVLVITSHIHLYHNDADDDKMTVMA